MVFQWNFHRFFLCNYPSHFAFTKYIFLDWFTFLYKHLRTHVFMIKQMSGALRPSICVLSWLLAVLPSLVFFSTKNVGVETMSHRVKSIPSSLRGLISVGCPAFNRGDSQRLCQTGFRLRNRQRALPQVTVAFTIPEFLSGYKLQ